MFNLFGKKKENQEKDKILIILKEELKKDGAAVSKKIHDVIHENNKEIKEWQEEVNRQIKEWQEEVRVSNQKEIEAIKEFLSKEFLFQQVHTYSKKKNAKSGTNSDTESLNKR
jgi:hypothetical protein